jgi:hypothetical protein
MTSYLLDLWRDLRLFLFSLAAGLGVAAVCWPSMASAKELVNLLFLVKSLLDLEGTGAGAAGTARAGGAGGTEGL